MEVHEIIKMRRIELGLSIREVAQKLGVAPSTVSRYESSDIQNMGIDKIESLAKVLCCSPIYLMGWQNDTDTNDEKLLISKYRLLNNEGKQKLTERADELLTLGYIKEDAEKMA